MTKGTRWKIDAAPKAKIASEALRAAHTLVLPEPKAAVSLDGLLVRAPHYEPPAIGLAGK